MSVQHWKRRLACQWSIELLFPALDQTTLFPVTDTALPHVYQATGYMWTFTFADNVPGNDPREAMKRWAPMARWLERHGYRCVRALQRGKKFGRYHIHAVTDQWWPIRVLLPVAARYGFGSLDVEEVPRKRLSYVARYVGKESKRWRIPKGVRLWSCVGFRGVRVNDIRCEIRTLTVLSDPLTYPYRLDSVLLWDGEKIGHYRRYHSELPEGVETYTNIMNLTKENIAHIGVLIGKGAIICVGEYRTCKGREIITSDKRTGKEKVLKMAEHGIEVGDSQISCSQWLAPDADIKAIKPAANKGEAVCVVIEGLTREYGITATSIHPLSSMSGKLD